MLKQSTVSNAELEGSGACTSQAQVRGDGAVEARSRSVRARVLFFRIVHRFAGTPEIESSEGANPAPAAFTNSGPPSHGPEP